MKAVTKAQMNISDVAKKAGVSTATVSRVLNGSGLVRPETRDLVLAVVNECGYTPSAIAQSLSMQATHNVGVVFPDIENPFFSGALKGITQTAEENHYNVFFFNSDETVWREHAILKVVHAQRLDGVIISPVNSCNQDTRELLEEFERQGIAVVLFDRLMDDETFSSVLTENVVGTRNAIQQLIKEGHRKIAIIEGTPTITPGRERLRGYLDAMEAAGLPVCEDYMLPADQKSDLAYEATKQFMELLDPPTAIFACNNMMTLGCLRYFTEHDIVIGRDVSLMGFDEIDTLRLIGYGLSVVNRSERTMGKLAMEMLLGRLQDPARDLETIRVPTQLILRGSEKLPRRMIT